MVLNTTSFHTENGLNKSTLNVLNPQLRYSYNFDQTNINEIME